MNRLKGGGWGGGGGWRGGGGWGGGGGGREYNTLLSGYIAIAHRKDL